MILSLGAFEKVKRYKAWHLVGGDCRAKARRGLRSAGGVDPRPREGGDSGDTGSGSILLSAEVRQRFGYLGHLTKETIAAAIANAYRHSLPATTSKALEQRGRADGNFRCCRSRF